MMLPSVSASPQIKENLWGKHCFFVHCLYWPLYCEMADITE